MQEPQPRARSQAGPGVPGPTCVGSASSVTPASSRSRPLAVRELPKEFRPWWAQRLACRLEREAMIVMGVAGRQGGKTEWGVWRVLRRGALRPNGNSLVLVPTYRMGLVHSARLKRLAAHLRAEWKEQKQVLVMPNGHHVWLRSSDRPDAARGLTVDATLWVDEAALVAEEAWQAALGCLVAARDPLVLVTTTPKGKNNWVYRTWTKPGAMSVARFLFRSGDSPYATQDVIDMLRDTLGGGMSLQELEAVFTDDRSCPFPPELVERMLKPTPRRGERWSIGLDLAKEKDWTVATEMNEFGEARVVGRWQHMSWPDTQARVVELARASRATLVVDEQFGGGYGGAMADYFERDVGKDRVLRVRTGNPRVKAEVIESLVRDAEHGRVVVDSSGPHAGDLRHELLFMTSSRSVSGGVERVTYQGPQVDGEHDDCVISLALANWGRIQAESAPDPLAGDFAGFGGVGPSALPSPAARNDGCGWGAVDGTGYAL